MQNAESAARAQLHRVAASIRAALQQGDARESVCHRTDQQGGAAHFHTSWHLLDAGSDLQSRSPGSDVRSSAVQCGPVQPEAATLKALDGNQGHVKSSLAAKPSSLQFVIRHNSNRWWVVFSRE